MFHAPRFAKSSVHELLQSDSFRRQMELVELWPAINPGLNRARVYRKEIERFSLWLVAANLTLATVGSADITAYRQFLTNPEPSSIWVATPSKPRTKHGILNSEWRPFAGPLQQSSAKQASSILHGFFEFMVAEGYCEVNPCRRPKRDRRQQPAPERKSLDSEQVLAVVFEHCRNQSSASELADRKKAIRDLWLLATCYLTGLSVSELLALPMSNLFQNQSGWWLKLGVSGTVTVAAPVGPELLVLMRRYRMSFAFSPLPGPGERDVPLVGDTRSGRRFLSESAGYKIVRDVFKRAALNANDGDIAAELRGLTPSQFRSYTLQIIHKYLGLARESPEYREGLRGVPSSALLRLSLQHRLP